MTKQIMIRAWEIARAGVDQFGGKSSEYLSESMKLAWENYKEGSHDTDRMEVIMNKESGRSTINIIKNNKIVKETGNIPNDKAHHYMSSELAKALTVMAADHFFLIDGKKVYRGREVFQR